NMPQKKSMHFPDNAFSVPSAVLVEQFNDYFINISKQITQDIRKVPLVPHNHNIKNIFAFKQIREADILKIIKDLDVNKATSGTISTLFNKCINENMFPAVLKKATVIPVYKTGDQSCFNNYRPISLLSVLSKIFKKVMTYQLTE